MAPDDRPAAASPSGRWEAFTYAGPSGTRPYAVYTPPGYSVGVPVPLIVMLHGCAQSPLDSATGTRWNDLADEHTVVVAYPQQLGEVNAAACWNWFLPVNQERGSGEAAIIAGITRQVQSDDTRWTIDPDRVFVAGMSAGGSTATILGATYPDVYAAIGVHSGVEFRAATDPLGASVVMQEGGPPPVAGPILDAMGAYARVMPTIVVHGTADQVVRPVNGDQVVAQWMAADRALSGGGYPADVRYPTRVTQGQVPGGHAYTVSRWDDDTGRPIQEYWQVHGLDHAWSGGSVYGSFTDPRGPDATAAMFTFFTGHPMPRPAP